MDAIILVGGQGTRLRPLTASRHKSLVPVGNQHAISYLFDWLGRSGITRVVLALGQHNEDLATAYPAGSVPGLEVVPVFEQRRLESGGAIRNAVAEAGIQGRFLVLNGDIYADFVLDDALQAHESHSAKLTLALSRVEDPSSFGVAVLDEQNMVKGFIEKPPRGKAPTNLVNAGVWIFEPELVDQIPEGAVRVEETLFPSLVAREQPVLGFPFEGRWVDIGTPDRYLALNVALAGQAEGGAIVDPGAEAAADACIRESCIGTGSRVGAGATVERSVLWESVEVGAGALVCDSILADGVRVGEGVRLEGVVAGSGATFPAGTEPGPGTVIEPGVRYGEEV